VFEATCHSARHRTPGHGWLRTGGEVEKKAELSGRAIIAISGFKRRQAADDFDHYFTGPVNLSSLLNALGATLVEEEQTTAATADPAPEKTWLQVLLIEDHAALSAAMAELLNREGFEVRTAFSGEEGLKSASDFRPQLILCDLNLPDMGGQEVIRRLRVNPVTRHAYAVILTALSEAEIRTFNDEARNLGVDEFIRKPLMPEVVHSLAAKLKR
jgi:CheY-like chemotaxis protein